MHAFGRKKKILFFCIIGTALEWYDFTIFGTLSSIIAQLFFPKENKLIGLFYTFSIFAIGFLIRPIGSVVLSHFGDKIGRKTTLCFSIIAMAIPTVLIGFLPTYAEIGFYAPLLLLLLRLLQGFAAGGEYAGIITYLNELSEKHNACFFSSFSAFGVVSGLLLGTIIGALVTNIFSIEQVHNFAWRIPFIISIALGFVSYYIRAKANETIAFEKAKLNGKIYKYPIVALIKKHTPSVLIVNNFFWMATVPTYLIFVYIPTKITSAGYLNINQVLYMTSFGILVFIALLPFFGYLADKVGKKLLPKIGALSFILFSYPIFLLFNTDSLIENYIGQSLFAVIMAIFVAAVPALSAILFPVNVRFSGIALGLNISASLFGGTAPLVAIWLLKLTNNLASPGLYLTSIGLIAFISLLFVDKYTSQMLKIDEKTTQDTE